MALKYTSIKNLKKKLKKKNFVLIKVHLDVKPQIEGTDNHYSPIHLDKFFYDYKDKEEEIVIYCRSGGTSSGVGAMLEMVGYTNVTSLNGGTDEWFS